jgi:D-glycerate 3-kinase
MTIAPNLVERTIAFALEGASGGVRVVGLSGVQGSGKSTFANLLAERACAAGHPALALGLDDFYFDRPDRERLAAQVHPLYATRGVPGTHDVTLITHTLAALKRGETVRLPQFDKGTDRRRPESDWPLAKPPLRLVIFEGWCVGIPAQDDGELLPPINALETERDPHAHWRQAVNAAQRERYEPLWASFDALIAMKAPDFESVRRWRDDAEAPLRAAKAPAAMSPEQIAAFVQHFERITRHGLATLPHTADLVITLDAARRVIDWTRTPQTRKYR